ncbi:conserved hypothetical protein [Talaromyces stipitatus ATCC 10500]|uniref:Uncharacterized protein n=1 Tax=Talaromyces stipitatus (strain ATCC 10500 / CBS 375.48 / QM 6759 / NRRL 1006) TaxID=441959 RepID=B8MQY3_TALSN|nr:uncharacterized protein TSTA_053360 [Talaromyces stipitatus ATCC 10500]EED12818.1 conserved hypothetical protein [Talaromyces stipitatus ATCC 10500]
MPPRTRKSAAASSSKLAGKPNASVAAADKQPIDVSSPVSEDGASSDGDDRLVIDEDEEDMEVFDMTDRDSTEINAPNKDGQRSLYAVGGGGYNALKTFRGQVYSGMAIGGSHKWNYDQGVWKETKVEPDRWEIDYNATKRRARKAPKGSGVPVGTEYHWFIIAHQYVVKQDDNTYETHLVGSKYKLAHKSISATAWSVPTVKAQRERETDILEDAKRRVQGLPPVLAAEKAKVGARQEKGQQTLDTLFGKRKGTEDSFASRQTKKRKMGSEE